MPPVAFLQAEASSADPACTSKSPYIVLLDQFSTPTTIGGTRAAPLLEQNITNFKVLGGECAWLERP